MVFAFWVPGEVWSLLPARGASKFHGPYLPYARSGRIQVSGGLTSERPPQRCCGRSGGLNLRCFQVSGRRSGRSGGFWWELPVASFLFLEKSS
jgi:hypothetical protein